METPRASHDPVRQRCSWVLRHPVRNRLDVATYDRMARVRDLVWLVALLPVWLLLLGVVAGAVKLERPQAPAFFRQERTGRHGHRFNVLKFRTMVPNAEELKHELRHLNELTWPDFKISNDPRVTRLGKILRATGLDELPQLINVIGGQMSLVGPRPTSFGPETYRTWQTERLDARPGLTGLWQIVGRANTLIDDRIRLEIAHVRRRSLWLDMVILLRTVPAVLRGEGK